MSLADVTRPAAERTANGPLEVERFAGRLDPTLHENPNSLQEVIRGADHDFLLNERDSRCYAIAARYLMHASHCTIDKLHDDADLAVEYALQLIEQTSLAPPTASAP